MAKADWMKRRAFAQAFAELGNATQAAIAAGVPQSSAHSMGYRWLRDETVAGYVRDAMNERLRALGPLAIKVVQDILLSEHATPQTRLQAARDILDRLGWVPPKRSQAVVETGEKELVEMSIEELETMLSGDPHVRLDQKSLELLAAGA